MVGNAIVVVVCQHRTRMYSCAVSNDNADLMKIKTISQTEKLLFYRGNELNHIQRILKLNFIQRHTHTQ